MPTITVSAPTSALHGVSVNVLFTPDTLCTTTLTLGAGFTPSSLTWSNSSTPQTSTLAVPTSGVSVFFSPAATNGVIVSPTTTTIQLVNLQLFTISAHGDAFTKMGHGDAFTTKGGDRKSVV